MPRKHVSTGAIQGTRTHHSRSSWSAQSANIPSAKRWDQGFGVRWDEKTGDYVPWLTAERAAWHAGLAAAAGFAVAVVERPSGVWAVSVLTID